MISGRTSSVRLMAMDVVLVATGYVVGLDLLLGDGSPVDAGQSYLNLAVALPFIALIHFTVSALGGVYRQPHPRSGNVSTRAAILASTVSVLIVLAWATASTERLVPVSVVVVGGLATIILIGLARFWRSAGRRWCDRLPTIS